MIMDKNIDSINIAIINNGRAYIALFNKSWVSIILKESLKSNIINVGSIRTININILPFSTPNLNIIGSRSEKNNIDTPNIVKIIIMLSVFISVPSRICAMKFNKAANNDEIIPKIYLDITISDLETGIVSPYLSQFAFSSKDSAVIGSIANTKVTMVPNILLLLVVIEKIK